MTVLARAVLHLLVALVTAWLGLLQPFEAEAVPATAANGYAYDGQLRSSADVAPVSERGPPRALASDFTHDAVDGRSDGVSVRPGTPTTYGYNARLQLVGIDSTAPVPLAAPVAAERRAFAVARWHVAAKTAAKACSFAGTTTVLMADGSRKPIEDVKVGDKVVATDPETGEQVAKRVEHVFVHADTVIDLVVEGEVITTTEDHPFWSVTDQRFERADELSTGEKVLGADGRVITVSGLEFGTAREALAYNLEIEGIHTYHVGQSSILAHNTCPVGHGGHQFPDVVPRKSQFFDNLDLNRMTDTDGMTGYLQPNGKMRYVKTYRGGDVGVDATTGLPTDMYTIIRWPDGSVVTMYPGTSPMG